MICPSVTPVEQLQAISSQLKHNNPYPGQTAHEIRAALEESAGQLPALNGVQVEQVQTGRFSGEWVRAVDPGEAGKCGGPLRNDRHGDTKVILYIHGGGFVAGSCAVYRDLAARLSAASGLVVLTVEYRLAPEFHYPAAGEDCLSAYEWLLDQGFKSGHIIFGGDSVGATLALMTLISLRDGGKPLPGGAFLLSPHGDLVHLNGESYTSQAHRDPTGSRETNQRILEDYLGEYAGEAPAQLSPLRQDLSGLPPLFIQAGDQEVLLSDAERLAAKAAEAGTAAQLEVWENMWSVFQLMAAFLPEAQQAIYHIGEYVKERLKLEAEL